MCFHALGFAEKPLEVLAPEGINNILIASVVAGVLIIVSAIVTGIISNLRKHIIAKTIFSVNGVSGLVFYVSLIALLLPMLGMELRGQRAVSYPVHRGAVLPDVLCRAAERAVRRRKARGLGGRYPSQWFF